VDPYSPRATLARRPGLDLQRGYRHGCIFLTGPRQLLIPDRTESWAPWTTIARVYPTPSSCRVPTEDSAMPFACRYRISHARSPLRVSTRTCSDSGGCHLLKRTMDRPQVHLDYQHVEFLVGSFEGSQMRPPSRIHLDRSAGGYRGDDDHSSRSVFRPDQRDSYTEASHCWRIRNKTCARYELRGAGSRAGRRRNPSGRDHHSKFGRRHSCFLPQASTSSGINDDNVPDLLGRAPCDLAGYQLGCRYLLQIP